MRDLPIGWEYRRVDQVGDVQIGRQRSPSVMTGPYLKPYLRVANVLDGHIDYSDVLEMNFAPYEAQIYELKHGDVLLNEGQALDLVGRCAVFDGPSGMCFQNTLLRFRPRAVLPRFAAAIFKHWLDEGEFRKLSRQTTSIAHLGVGQFSAMRFPLAPIKEQQRITEILESLNEEIESTERLLRKEKSLEESVIGHIFDSINDNEFPLAEIASPEHGSTTIGPFGSNLVADDYRDRGVPVVFVQDIRSGEFNHASEVFIRATKARELKSHSACGGDLLMTKMGEPPCIAAVYPPGMPDAVITADIIRVRPNTHIVDVEWLAYSVNHERFRCQVRAITGGVTRAKVTLADVRKIRTPLPALGAQNEAVSTIHTIRNRRLATGETLSKLRLLKQGLTDDLLTGRMRVPVESMRFSQQR